MKRLTMTIAALAALTLLGKTVLAAPSISGVQGTVGNKQSVTIQGSNFGTKSPAAPQVWADFESSMNPGPGGIKQSWDQVQNMMWVKGEGWAGSNCAKASDGGGVWSLRTDYDAWSRDGQTMYIHKKERQNFIVNDPSQNWKTWRMWTNGNGYPNIYSASNNGRVFVEKVSASDSGFFGSFQVGSTNWYTNEILFRASTINQKNGWVQIRFDGRTVAEGSVETRSSSAPDYMTWNYVIHGVAANPGLWSPGWSSNNRIWADDIYVDTTYSRVMLGNASTFAGSTHLEIQLPTAWSAGAISIIAHTGTFPAGAKAYLYVFDSANQVNANGFPVTIGAAGNAQPTETAAVGPVANAGPDSVAAVGSPVALAGAVGNPTSAAAATTVRWTVVSGPGTATIADPTSADTTVKFSAPGAYVLQLTATDGTNRSIDSVTIQAVPSVATTGVQPKNVFNPANGETFRILAIMDQPGHLEAQILDRTGHLVRSLDGGDRPTGEQYLEWDGRNDQGDTVASGIYVVVKKFAGHRATTKVAVIK